MIGVYESGIRERRAHIILLVRSVEESDPEGLVLPLRERTKASRRALMVTGLSGESGDSAAAWKIRAGEAVLRRARLLFDGLVRQYPGLPRVLHLAQLGSSTAPTVLVLAFIAGLTTHALGFQREINLLSVPLLGLLVWNLAVYAAMLALPLIPGHRAVGRFTDFLSGILLRGAMARRIRSARVAEGRVSPEFRIIVKAVMRFGAMWHRMARRLLAARVRRILHLGAIAMIAGVVVGMYLRGVAFEYRVTWESTWLDAAQVQTLMNLILGPAAWLTGLEIPQVAPLRGPEGSGPAATWIHLYAVTAVWVVGVPRGVMAAYQGWRAKRLGKTLPLDLGETYYRRLFTAWRGAKRYVEIFPYSYTPRPESSASLKTLLFDYFGARADLRVRDPLPYGAETEAALPGPLSTASPDDAELAERDFCIVVVFNLAQSPESEVHGALLEELTTTIDTKRAQLLVVLDTSAYRERVDDRDRVRQRIDAWSRVVHEAGLTAVPVDLARHVAPAGSAGERTKEGSSEDLLSAVRAALWPDREAAQAT
jgi:hypothetical protein